MEIAIFLILGLLIFLYLLKPVTNLDKESFKNKNITLFLPQIGEEITF